MEFSVLMSVYHKEKAEYLDAALKSIINQTAVPSEIVLVKDGPLTEQLDFVIEKHKKEFSDLNIVELKENIGLGKALEYGLLKCKHEIVARMDSDDISIANRFEEELKILESNNEYDIVGSNVYEFEDDINKILSMKIMPENNLDIIKYSKSRNPMSHQTVMFKKKAVLNAGSYKHFPLFEDYYLWGRMINNKSVFYNIQKPLLYFRSNKDTFYRRGGWRYLQNEIKLFSIFLDRGIITKKQFVINVICRIPTRLAPAWMRGLLYTKVLREKVGN